MTEHPATDSAMDQALDWLIRLECASAGERLEFEQWLGASTANAQAFARASAVWNSAAVNQAAKQLDTVTPRSWRARLRPFFKPMAAVAVILVGVFTFTNLPLRLEADHLTVVGERQRLELDDGSKVLLNTNTAFSSHIDKVQREARLYQGEAFFQVNGSRQQPLELQAGPVRATVRDTDFAVRLLDGVAQVQVQRGNVDLLGGGDARVRLSAGDSIRIGPKGFGQRQHLDAQKDLAWVQGRLVFENCPLSQVLDELRRYYPGWIVNTNEQLAKVEVTGNYRLENPLDVVRSLAHITSASMREYPALVILN
ncbi:putative regulatory protein [Pseudomonas sp. M47T1]|nr:putative regulatory protein [Pseudomonas sp. M47T1]